MKKLKNNQYLVKTLWMLHLLIILCCSCVKSQPTDKLIAFNPINAIHAVPFKDLKTNLFGIYDTLSSKWIMPAIYNEIDFVDGDKRLLLVLEKEKYKIVTMDNKEVLHFRSYLWIDAKKVNENCFRAFESTLGLGSSADETSIIMIDKNTIQVKSVNTYNVSDVLINENKTMILTFNLKSKSASLVDFHTKQTIASFENAELYKKNEYLISGYLNHQEVLIDFLGNKQDFICNSISGQLFNNTYEVRDIDYNHGVINEKGKLIIPLKYKYIYQRNSNCLDLEDKEGKHYVYLKHTNKIIPSKKYHSNKKYTIIENDSIKQIIDTLGNVVFDYSDIANVSSNSTIIEDLNKSCIYTFEKKLTEDERENYYYENAKYPEDDKYEGMYKIEQNKFVAITTKTKYKYMSRTDDGKLFCGHIKLKENKQDGTSIWKSEVLDSEGKLLFANQYVAGFGYHAFNSFNDVVIFKGTDGKTYQDVIRVFNKNGNELLRDKKYTRIINSNTRYLFAINKNQLDIYDKNMSLYMSATIPQNLIDKDFYCRYDSLSGAIILDFFNNYFLNQNTKQFSRSYKLSEYKAFNKNHIVYNHQDENDEDSKTIYYMVDKNGEIVQGANNNISYISYQDKIGVLEFTYNDEKIELYDLLLNNILPITAIETLQYDDRNKLIYIETKNPKATFYITNKGKRLEK